MGEMVFQLLTIPQQLQMFLGPADMIFDAAPGPFIVGMFSHTVAHDAGDYLDPNDELHRKGVAARAPGRVP